ncbi:MAG: hypothetical protein JWN67_1642 [Actinomycetia bacterium]|nr:hypothetical protein [Actinomycetes bacterium]
MNVRVVAASCVLATALAGCARSASPSDVAGASTSTTTAACDGTQLRATEVGVTADTITVEVMADVGNPLAPGLFQGNIDALRGFATYVNAHGGIACRQLVVKEWDSHLDPSEAKNGQIDACQNAFALVGSNALFNPDVSTMAECEDQAGAATGLPDLPGTANDPEQLCNSTTFLAASVVQRCPVATSGPQHFTANAGSARFYVREFPELRHSMYMIPGDLPTTIQSATYIIKTQELGGVHYEATPKVSGRTEQAGYTPIIQTMRSLHIDAVTDGSNDTAMIRMRREAKAQGYDGVKVWTCIPSCYSKNFLASAADVDGTYVTLGHLPFEEKDTNEDLAAFVDSVGDEVNGFGALAWQSADLFKQAVDDVVADKGPNGLTRANLLAALGRVKDFDANGWAARKATLRSSSPCFVIIQLRDGAFHRVHPTKRGTMDCDPKNLVEFDLDPVAEAAKIP